MILCAGRNESFDFAKPIGVGLVESAICLTRYIMEEKPSFLFFIGTAGSYGKYAPLDLVYSYRAANIEQSVLLQQSYTPLVPIIDAKIEYKVSRETNIDLVTVNSSNYITTSQQSSYQLLDQNIAVENMEFFSVVSVANAFHTPCLGLFVVTNYCDSNAHQDFITNHAKAKELLTLHVEKNMKI